jgi:hypothetical protein
MILKPNETQMTKRKYKLILPVIMAVIAQLVAPTLVEIAYAAPQFSETFVRLDRHRELVGTGATVCVKPTAASTAGVETEIKITFPTKTGTDFVVNSTAANWTVTTTNLPVDPADGVTGATAWPGIATATNVTGKTVTFPSNDLTANVFYCFNITATNTLTNGSAGASSTIINATLWTEDTSDVIINQTNWSTAVIANDQILVTAVVPPNFSITLDGNLDAFSTNLDPASIVSTAGRTVSITTNAVGGWIAWVKSNANPNPYLPGLYSATANYAIESGLKTAGGVHGPAVGDPAFDLVAGREGYVLDVDLTTDGTGGCGFSSPYGVDAAFNSASGNGGGRLSSNFRPIASCGGTPPATSDGDVLTLFERATIRGGTPAGSDYSDTLTIVGAGNF